MALNPNSFDESSPAFLALIRDRNPQKLGEGISAFAGEAYLELRAHPKVFPWGSFSQDDAIQEVILHFISSNCAKLKRYRDEGKPFRSWFNVVATRKIYDLIRQNKAEQERNLDFAAANPDFNWVEEVPSKDLGGNFENWDVLLWRKIEECVKKLTAKCKALILLAAGESDFERRKIMMGCPEKTNKQMSDDLRFCRKRLRACLENEGIDISEYL